MKNLRALYRIGMGPSISHTMGPRRATGAIVSASTRFVETMNETGRDLPSLYRETSTGGLARWYADPVRNPGISMRVLSGR